MSKTICAIAIVLLTACGEPRSGEDPADSVAVGTPAPPNTPASRDKAPDRVAPESLVGEYRVAGIDGTELGGAFGIAVSIDAAAISYEPRCLGFARTYRYRAGAIALERDPRYGPTRSPDGSVTNCLVAAQPEFHELANAFDAADQVRRTPANGIEFSGNGRSITLFSQ